LTDVHGDDSNKRHKQETGANKQQEEIPKFIDLCHSSVVEQSEAAQGVIDLYNQASTEIIRVDSKESIVPSDQIQNTTRTNKRKRLFRCDVCFEDDLEEWMCHMLSTCYHRFCVNCLSKHIRFSATTRIKCPSCSKFLDVLDIRIILESVGDAKTWQSYSERASVDLLEQEITSGESGTRRCPADRCNYTFVYEPRDPELKEGTRFDCPKCQESFCLQCGANQGQVGPVHQGSCYDRRKELMMKEEARRKLEEWKVQNSQADARFKQLLDAESQQGITKPCPRCKTPITKNGGCNHMRCRCGYDYDWSSCRRRS